MRLFRFFHRFIASALLLTVFVAVLMGIELAKRPQAPGETIGRHLDALLVRPATISLSPLESLGEHITLSFGTTVASVDSESLLRTAENSEELFVPLLTTPKTLRDAPLAALPIHIPTHKVWDELKVRLWVASVSASINTHAVPPFVTYVPRSSPPYNVFPGKSGVGIDTEATTAHIMHSANLTFSFEAPSIAVAPPLSTDELGAVKSRLDKLVTAKLIFTAQNRTFSPTPQDLISLVVLPTGFSEGSAKKLISSWAKDFNIPTVEPDLSFDGKTIRSFRAPIEGRALDEEKSTQLLLASLFAFEQMGDTQSKELVTTTLPPKISLSSLNSLGITDRIGRGDSQYYHSIPNRVFNVGLATARLHGAIIPVGATFSFNHTLGEVSAATGFKQAYVINQGQTVLGDGGGVCQVSSTLFRALLSAGLPILERRGHSYRVGYYEQNSKPGFDATVSAPHPDLVFLNDTGAPILINAQADTKTLRMYIELYGKKDGRKAEVVNYRQWDQSPAPPTLYQDDPTLPRGTIKQIDFAAGGLKTSFVYKVTYASGEVKERTYQTNYIPWRAVYLRGTQ